MNRFSTVSAVDPDPILQANAEAQAAGPDALNATVGVLMNEERKLAVFPSVAAAMKDVLSPPWALGYPPSLGTKAFRGRVRELFFGGKDDIAVAATAGGSAALRMQLELLKRTQARGKPSVMILAQGPTWPVYQRICAEANVPLTVTSARDGATALEAFLERLETGWFVPLMQSGGHNPTGKDRSPEEWKRIGETAQKANVPLMLDMAYQGLFGEVSESPVETLRATGTDILAVVSFSKNHTMYGLRTGAAALLPADRTDPKPVEAQYGAINGGMGTAPVPVGQWIVEAVQSRYPNEWQRDLHETRDSLDTKRQRIADGLAPPFADAMKGRGMFALLPLSPAAVMGLRPKDKIFLPPDGRLNISAVPLRMIDDFCRKLNAAAEQNA